MRRREFIAGLGGAAAGWPLAAHAQQSAMPVVGLLRGTPAAPFRHLVTALRQGLDDERLVEGRNVAIEQHWADNHRDRLPAMAADLVRRGAAVIVGNVDGVEAARAATKTIPIVFVTGDDPVKSGLVKSVNQPESNLTGVTFFGGSQLNVKRLELLRDLVPTATVIAALADLSYPIATDPELSDVVAAGRALGRRVAVMKIAGERDFEPTFEAAKRAGAGALLVSGSPFFTSQRRTLIALAARYSIPAIYDLREFVADGGLISYSASLTNAYRQAGAYAGKLINGAKPSELPVLQPVTFEMAVNLKTAKALGLEVPSSIHLRADEVIE
jgi:putative ABC transport system substrate-binding protein